MINNKDVKESQNMTRVDLIKVYNATSMNSCRYGHNKTKNNHYAHFFI